SFRQSCNSILRCPSISDGRLSYQFSSDGYIRRSVYAYEYRVKRYRKYPRQHLEDLRTGKKEELPKDDDGCTGSNAVFGVITHIINDARSGEFDDCPVM
ncbi:LexA family transcriptional regulator, partial [Escherichia coli]|nr:LexA family transcriptional regulator [Escherichia coli]